MPHEVIMPALGMAQDTGLIVAWHKAPGDAVRAGDVLFEVETDKATMEVEAQADGILGNVRASAGDEVPVGQTIAVIGESADTAPPEPAPATAQPAAAPEVPAGHAVIMPALGMAQDTGLIVAWHKAPGDAVSADDILFEVETDKSTMEVEAGFDGFVAALLAEAGDEAPVGETIAVISDKRPDAPVRAGRSPSASAAPAPAEAPSPVAAEPAPPRSAAARPAAAPRRADGRILASPKARRLALEQGLDLSRLVDAGHPQPFHAADLEVLKTLPVAEPAAGQGGTRRLTADLPADGFAAFADWAEREAGLGDSAALLAGLAAAGLARPGAVVAVEGAAGSRHYAVPDGPLAAVAPAPDGAAPDLCVRDLRHSRIASVALGAEAVPVLTLVRAGAGLSLTLECADRHLTAAEAVGLLSDFAGRMEQPLRHLL